MKTTTTTITTKTPITEFESIEELEAFANDSRRRREQQERMKAEEPHSIAQFSLEHLAKTARTKPNEAVDEAERVKKMETLRAQTNLPTRHKKLERFENEAWIEKCATLKGRLGSGFTMALLGNRGTGKTQMAVELIEHATSRLLSARFCTAMEFFLKIKGSYRDESMTSEEGVIRKFCAPKLLVIDETQERGETPWEDRLLTYLMNERYNDLKDTLLISNQTKEEFTMSIGSSVSTRLNETGAVIVCNWKSFRE